MVRLALIAVVGAFLVGCGVSLSTSAPFNPDPGFPVGPISGSVSHQNVKLDSVEEALAPGSGGIVNCWSSQDWTQFEAWLAASHKSTDVWGLTFTRTDDIELSPFVCQVLAQALSGSAQQQPLFTAVAVTVLAHESAHASGIKAEDEAECRAIRTEPRAAQLLGIPKALAIRFQHIYRGTFYPQQLPQYRTPVCKAGLPGVVVPDTLGTTADLRPLQRTAKAVARGLPGWRNVGGGLSVAPLSPCALVESRTSELARFGDALLGPHGASVQYTGVRTQTRNEFATAQRRYAAFARCDLTELRTQLSGTDPAATVANGRIPDSINRLSPRVHAFREIYTSHGETWNRDKILVFDPADRAYEDIIVKAPARSFPLSVEQGATEAMLHALDERG